MGVDESPALLDTSVLIALTQEGRVVDLSPYDRLFVSSISYAELRLGVASARTVLAATARAAALEEVLDLLGEGLPFDDAAALAYGRILQTVVRRQGQPKAHMNDRMIAAVAAANDLTLLTYNASDLTGLEDHLRVIDLNTDPSE